VTSLVLTNLIQQQPIDFFRLFDVTPIANNDFFAIDQDSSDNQLDIFQNDVDPNGDPIFISNIVPASHGDISYSSDATTFQYTPTAGFYGIDTFQYSITSGYGDVSSNATVEVFVNKTGNNPPVAPEIDIVLPTNTYTATFNALTNATDPDGDIVSLYAVTSPSLGSVSNDASGNIYYTRNPNLFGQDSFTYIVTDGNGGFGVGNVTILQVDTDGDGMPDQWEMKYGLDPTTDDSMNDPDGDGLPNLAEFVLGTNPNVPDNPLNLSVVTNGMQFNGFVQIPILGLSPALAQTPPITFYVNGAPAENSFISQGADGQWLINWDTTYLTNGNYQIQASVQYNMLADITAGQSNEVFGTTKTVQVNNPITFDKLTTTFGNDLYITGTLADTNDTYDVYLYDPDGNLLVYATNVFAPNGQIGLSWDLTDGNGNQISFGNIQAEFYLHSQSDTNDVQPLDQQYSGSAAVHHWYLTDTLSVDANVFAVAWGFDTYFTAFNNYRTELMEDDVIEILDNPSDFNSYTLLPANNVPYADSTFRYDDNTDKSVLVNPSHPGKGDLALSGNFFWFGHGAANAIAGNPKHSIITALDVINTLNNKAYTTTDKTPENNDHPYKLVILNGCQTYSYIWASAFGIDYSANNSSDLVSDYTLAGRQPRAFVGWTKEIGVPGYNDIPYEGMLDADYGEALGVMFQEWMAGYPIYQCVEDFSDQALLLVPLPHLFENVDSWKISGCYDLERGD
ncbi:MAG: Ig-like domain-containing protein, partial [Limisphaerales bacterium]